MSFPIELFGGPHDGLKLSMVRLAPLVELAAPRDITAHTWTAATDWCARPPYRSVSYHYAGRTTDAGELVFEFRG